jgi:hypothetical protein
MRAEDITMTKTKTGDSLPGIVVDRMADRGIRFVDGILATKTIYLWEASAHSLGFFRKIIRQCFWRHVSSYRLECEAVIDECCSTVLQPSRGSPRWLMAKVASTLLFRTAVLRQIPY